MKSSDEIGAQFPRMIAFFGPDGAGKSTQAQLAVDTLKSNGLKVKKVWVRSVHSIAFLLWNLFRKLNLCSHQATLPLQLKRGTSHSGKELSKAVIPISMTPPILKGSVSRLLWSAIEFTSILPILLLRVYIPLLLGHYIIAERYVVDSIVTVAYFVNDSNFVESLFAKLLLKFVPKGTIFIFIDANYDIIVRRRGIMAGPYEYTEFHRRMFEELTPIVGAIYVDASNLSVQETHEKIMNAILKKKL